MSSYWSEVCSAAEARPLQELLNDLYASGGVLISAFIACAIAQGVAFARWRKWSDEEKATSWKLYGWFTALSCMGCVVGAIAYAARVAHLYNVYNVISVTLVKNPSMLQQQLRNELQRDRLRWAAAHFMIYPFELMLVTLANMCVLHRLHHFSLSSSLSPLWVRAKRIYGALMLAGMLVGIGGNFATGAGFSQSAESYNEAVTALAAKDLAAAKRYSQQGSEIYTKAAATAAVQRFSEASILLALIAAFVLVGQRSFRVILTALRRLSITGQKISAANAESHSQQRKLVADASLKARKLLRKVVITFLLGSGAVRAVFQIMYAIAMSGQDQSNTCSTSSCNPCKNVYSNIQNWILYTPTFQMITMLIASPLTLAVALWGMSGSRAMEEAQLRNSMTMLQPAKSDIVI